MLPLVEYARSKQKITDDRIRLWVNSKSKKDKFTPMHFASFKGDMQAIRILVDNYGDIYSENEFGLGMLHVAA